MLFDSSPSVEAREPSAPPLHPLELYGRLLDAASGDDGVEGAVLRHADGATEPLALHRWLGPATSDDRIALHGIAGPVLDVGCGPGRLLAALSDAGHPSMGIDVSPVAVRLARRGGGRAMMGTVFSPSLETGWGTVLLMDGNVGIGGRPSRLLARVAALLRPGGQVIAELEPSECGSRTDRIRLEWGEHASDWFSWARLDAEGLAAAATTAGLRVVEVFGAPGRRFARLVHHS